VDVADLELISDAGSVAMLLERMHEELGDVVVRSQDRAEEVPMRGKEKKKG
jgi:hypothetical protein